MCVCTASMEPHVSRLAPGDVLRTAVELHNEIRYAISVIGLEIAGD